ncbi:MAG: hypothetical protein IPL61_13385 [Myxococcales bacterium]|nr:hypothetical protein [Myxococcales bacterium]
MRCAWSLVLASSGGVLIACGGAPARTAPPAARPLCVDPAAPGGIAFDAAAGDDAGEPGDEPAAAALPADWVVLAAAPDDAGGRLLVGVEGDCGQTSDADRCNPTLFAVPAGATPTVRARAELQFDVELAAIGDLPVRVVGLAVDDRDGDGARDVWVTYELMGPPQPAVGSTTTTWVASFAVETLAPHLTAQVGAQPEAEVLDLCTSTLHAVDADCDGDLDVVQVETCQPQLCAGDEPDPETCAAGPTTRSIVHVRQADGGLRAR